MASGAGLVNRKCKKEVGNFQSSSRTFSFEKEAPCPPLRRTCFVLQGQRHPDLSDRILGGADWALDHGGPQWRQDNMVWVHVHGCMLSTPPFLGSHIICSSGSDIRHTSAIKPDKAGHISQMSENTWNSD